MTTTQRSGDRALDRRKHRMAYTSWIEELCSGDPGARAALRGGLRRDLDAVPRMHRLVAPWLPPAATEETQRAYYAVASMIADQPRSRLAGSHPGPDDSDSAPEANATTGGGNAPQRYGTSLGLSFALAVAGGPTRDREMRATTAETRLNLLTRQSAAGLYRHLPASVRYLRQLDTPIDWAQLLDDLLAWPQHSGRIARRWLQDYYRTRSEQDRRAADQDDEAEQQNENNTTIDTP